MHGDPTQNPARHEVRIRCLDLAGGQHNLIVFGDRGDMVLVLPPAATAVLTLPQVEQLCALLAPDPEWRRQ